MAEGKSKQEDQEDSYVSGDYDDPVFFGAKKIVDAELKLIHKKPERCDKKIEELAGLALSGGGIRSASFALGIMQALAHKNWLSNIDYLSTVSGGGYIGSSLTWLLSRSWKLKDGNFLTFNTTSKKFPYVTYPMSGDAYLNKGKPMDLKDRISNTISETVQGKMLHYLRQNAKYLTPGDGINLFSLIAVLLRGAALGLITYLGLLALVLVFFGYLDDLLFERLKLFCPVPIPLLAVDHKCNLFLVMAILGAALYFVSLPLFSLWTYFVSRARGFLRTVDYYVRHYYDLSAGIALPLILLFAVVGIVPLVTTWIEHTPKMAFIKFVYSLINGMKPPNESKTIPGFLGVISVIIGMISGLAAFIKTSRIKAGKIPIGLLVSIGTAALLFGMLLLAFQISLYVSEKELLFPLFIITIGLSLGVNLNYISVHRYYRDRLMETFMPDVPEIMSDSYERSHKTKEANKMPLNDTCGGPAGNENNAAYAGPYHIINTNVVLVSSQKGKYRGRGGDSFILTREYCGSNATGWIKTKDYMNNTMNLATAMAISGAAVNPDTGGSGKSITRQPFLSMLMAMLNLRLGYWVPNPQKCKCPLRPRIPNYILPGLWEITFRNKLKEKATFLQLSDGGHFDNLALYELIRRRLGLIIVCDGGADPNLTFGDLANAMEKVRADFGALIVIKSENLKVMIPPLKSEQVKLAKKGFLMADIIYADNSKGKLIYINTTLCKGLYADLYGYKKQHPSFPEESTSNQFFDEKQFEAYRELGFQIAWDMMKDDSIINDKIVQNIMQLRSSEKANFTY